MSLELLVAVAQIAGSIAVVVTVVFLAMQVRENTKVSRMTGHQMASDGWLAVAHLVAEDPEIARIYREGIKDLRSLSTDDQWRFGALMQIAFASNQNAFLFGEHATHAKKLEDQRANWLVNQPGPRYWWPRARNLYHPDFQVYVDEMFARADANTKETMSPTPEKGAP